MKNKKGFTLIEMMIVIAIIGILSAIIIPLFVNSRLPAPEMFQTITNITKVEFNEAKTAVVIYTDTDVYTFDPIDTNSINIKYTETTVWRKKMSGDRYMYYFNLKEEQKNE